MGPLRSAAIVALALAMATGCASVKSGAPMIATNGPVTVKLFPDREAVRLYCFDHALPIPWNGGCFIPKRDGSFEIVCPLRDVDCLAHEIRHKVEPGWRHPVLNLGGR